MAKYLIDVNLPRHISVWSAADCEFVVDMDARWHDIKIWDYAHANALTIVTKDADFADLVVLRAEGPSVIQVRVGNIKFRELDNFLSTPLA